MTSCAESGTDARPHDPHPFFLSLPRSNVSGAQRELLKYYASVTSNRWLMLKIFGVLIIFVRRQCQNLLETPGAQIH